MYQAIDIHGHLGTPSGFPQTGLEKEFLNLSLEALHRQYQSQNITAACLSPMEALFPCCEQTLLDANSHMEELSLTHSWLYQWVVVDPLYPASFQQAQRILKSPKCVGVKLHPDANGYAIRDYGDELFSFCREQRAILETHSGDTNSMPEDFLPLADRFPEVTVILSHVGCGYDGDITHQVRAVQAARHRNLYTDVSSGKSLLNHLVEWAAGELPPDRLLFGTDTPIHHVPMMKQRVEWADLTETQKERIFYRNALELLGHKLRLP